MERGGRGHSGRQHGGDGENEPYARPPLVLKTFAKYDDFGRATSVTRPNGQQITTVYDIDRADLTAVTVTAAAQPPQVVIHSERSGRTYSGIGTFNRLVPFLSTFRTLSIEHADPAGRLVESNRYFDLKAGATGVLPSRQLQAIWEHRVEVTNPNLQVVPDGKAGYYPTLHEHDEAGRLHRTTNAVGTITQTTYNEYGEPTAVKVGTNGNLALVESRQYDGNQPGGNGNLTRVIQHPSGTAGGTAAGTAEQTNRVTEYTYDWRNRQVFAQRRSGVGADYDTYNVVATAPSTLIHYDNLDQPIQQFAVDASWSFVAPATSPLPNKLRGLTDFSYDNRGRVYATTVHGIISTGFTGQSLTTKAWYDQRGNVIKQSNPGGLTTKSTHDGAGRPVAVYLTDDLGGTTSVTGDRVVEQTKTQYDAIGNPIFITTFQRRHDVDLPGSTLATTGELSGDNARVSFAANWYDSAGRLDTTVNYGTHGGQAMPARPAAAPARANADGFDPHLVTSFTYTREGWLQEQTDPRGIKTRREYDALGRTSKLIEAYTDGTPRDDSNRVVKYTYNGVDQVTSQSQVLPGDGTSTTTYFYGNTAAGTPPNNDLLFAVNFADGPREQYLYNALGEQISKTTYGKLPERAHPDHPLPTTTTLIHKAPNHG